MQLIFDYFEGKVNKRNKKRLIFINRMAYLMQEFESSSKEINELVNWLFCKSEGVGYHESDVVEREDFDLKPIKWLDDKRAIKEVWECDFHLYSYAILLHDMNYWNTKDVLTDIIKELYFRLDALVHPYQDDMAGRDLANIRYFIEFEYEEQ